jgi:septal ring factor EnvC (AmiA/AmiB activator)
MSAANVCLTGHFTLFYAAAALEIQTPMDLENLKLLEGRIGQLLDQHERLREQHEVLLQRLKEREKQVAEVTGQLRHYEQERSEIRSRLERILTGLEGLGLG